MEVELRSGGAVPLPLPVMTATPALPVRDRLAALWSLYEQLDALITPDEMEAYPALQHLGDLLEDLQLELGD